MVKSLQSTVDSRQYMRKRVHAMFYCRL